jgi:hypothetical protein
MISHWRGHRLGPGIWLEAGELVLLPVSPFALMLE